jgi:hypothetical protein
MRILIIHIDDLIKRHNVDEMSKLMNEEMWSKLVIKMIEMNVIEIDLKFSAIRSFDSVLLMKFFNNVFQHTWFDSSFNSRSNHLLSFETSINLAKHF